MKNPFPSPLLLAFVCAACISCGRQEPPTARHPDAPALPTLELPERPVGMPGPEDLPPCPGFLSAEDAVGDEIAGTALVFSAFPADDVANYYAGHLANEGWVMASSSRHGKERHVQFQRGPRFLRLQTAPAPAAPAASQIRLAWGLAGGGDAAMESHAPDFEEELYDAEPPSHEW